MSASLVGSEMCIRDSPDPEPPSKLSARRRSQQGSDSAAGGGVSWGFAPVSYTHLTLPTICSV
eukprot:12429981-Alexandrium_andersonii.AAC.1